MDEALAYAAGLFDGEGTIDIKDKVRMAVKMTDETPVRFLHKVLGGRVYQWKDTHAGRPVYEWRASGWSGTIDAIEYIMPYSIGKKRQLQVAYNYFEERQRYGYSKDVKSVASIQLRGLRTVESEPATFDIETMGLDPVTLPVLSCSIQYGDRESDILQVWKRDPASDRDVLIEIRDVLESAPFSIGWNSKRFDINYINTRLALHGERMMFLGSHTSADVLFDQMFGNKKRTSLVNAANQLGVVDAAVHKTPIKWDIWNAANAGSEEAMKYVLEHGKNDVVLTKRVYNAIT